MLQSFDFIADEASFEDKYHIVIGNPPYVEDFKSDLELSDKFHTSRAALSASILE